MRDPNRKAEATASALHIRTSPVIEARQDQPLEFAFTNHVGASLRNLIDFRVNGETHHQHRAHRGHFEVLR